MAPPMRFARAGSLPNVTNIGSMFVVPLARLKPVWVISSAAGLSSRALSVNAAA